jgi:hypothetical protein
MLASPECADTSDELTIVTGFREIVICTIVESCDDIVSRTSRGEHDDGSGLSLAPESPTDLDPIHPWELDIEDDHVIGIVHRFRISLGSYRPEGASDIDTSEIAGDSLCEGDVIFDEESMHIKFISIIKDYNTFS